MYWNAQLQVLPDLDGDGFPVAVQIGALSHYMQRIEQLSHDGGAIPPVAGNAVATAPSAPLHLGAR